MRRRANSRRIVIGAACPSVLFFVSPPAWADNPPPGPPPVSPASSTPAPAEAMEAMSPLQRLKVSLGGGIVYFYEPFQKMTALRPAEQLGVSFTPGGMPGEIGTALMLDASHVSLIRLEA